MDIKNGKPTFTYDNWYIEPQDNEKADDFSKRSSEKARKYINSYDRKNGSYYLYTLVTTEDPIELLSDYRKQ